MAQLTITVPDPQVPRVQAAMGKLLELRDGNEDIRDATAEEVRQYLVDKLKQVVFTQEKRDAAGAAEAGVTEVDAT